MVSYFTSFFYDLIYPAAFKVNKLLPKVAEDKESDTQEEEGDQATSEVDIPHNEESPGVLRCLQKGRKGT